MHTGPIDVVESPTKLVTCDPVDGVARIDLNRPETANVFDLATTRVFADCVDRSSTDPDVRAVLITGAGPRLCGGTRRRFLAAAEDRPSYIHQLVIELDDALQRLAKLNKPVFAAVHDAVAGAGLVLMLNCDVVVCSPRDGAARTSRSGARGSGSP